MNIYEILKCKMHLWEFKKKPRILVLLIIVYTCVYLLTGFYNAIKAILKNRRRNTNTSLTVGFSSFF